jgi:hypothetical protein
MKVKRQVYERAKRKCEKCARPLKMNQGDFHHTRDPTVTPRASTIRFLCPTCHRIYGHKRITIKRETFLGTEKQTKTVRQEVVKIKKPARKKPKTKRVAIRDFFGDVIGYRTVKIRKSKATRAAPALPLYLRSKKLNPETSLQISDLSVSCLLLKLLTF